MGSVTGAVRAYLLLVWMWSRAAWQYRASLLILTVTQVAANGLDFATIWILFAHTPVLGGFSLSQVMFLYGTAATSFAVTDMFVGNTERLGRHVREGTFDVMLIRPVSALAQLAADDFSPRRLGRVVPSGAALVVALATVPVHWTVLRGLMVAMMVVCGALIFGAVFVAGAAFQFVAGDAAEVMNAFTYGGQTAMQYPLSVYGRDVMRLLTYGVPLAFVNWQPALYVLDRPDPLGLPLAFRFATPVVTAVLCLLAGLVWRTGVHHYRSTGS
ncbi:MAG: ABC transporter permease [Mycobacteriales bacterium]